jgi:hypothetical protein
MAGYKLMNFLEMSGMSKWPDLSTEDYAGRERGEESAGVFKPWRQRWLPR